ncbi:MAG: FAD-binding domain-containing protein [Pseudomonadota bacterium]
MLPLDLPPDPPSSRLQRDWPATRAEGLRRVAAFAPRMGGAYKSGRNHDLGPDRREHVSLLSPYLARRMVSEAEVVEAALGRFRLSTAEKFVQEVVWRTYFKGWLEQRPRVWDDYRAGLAADRAGLAADPALAARVAAAMEGRTGIDAFDAWAAELVETNYLHNHARMWFASIWIFTLGLPWRLGADFFLRHLLDGDAASNTLGWRWVAGLHTRGKCYAATAANIRKYTDGRFDPAGLVRDPAPLDEGPLPARGALRVPEVPGGERSEGPAVLLLTTEDLGGEGFAAGEAWSGVATLQLTGLRSGAYSGPETGAETAAAVHAFDAAALADAAARAGQAGPRSFDAATAPGDIVDWARGDGATRIVTGFVHAGWVADWLAGLRPALAAAGIALEERRRAWDAAFHPHCAAGFFKVKGQIPAALRALGLPA